MVRVIEGGEDLVAVVAARELEQAVDEREPERLEVARLVGVPQVLDVSADRSRAQRARRNELEEALEQQRLLREQVALEALAAAGPLLDGVEQLLGLVPPPRRLTDLQRQRLLARAAQLQQSRAKPPRLAGLPTLTEPLGAKHA